MLDVNSRMQENATEYLSDGLHLNFKGQEVVFNMLLDMFNQQLKTIVSFAVLPNHFQWCDQVNRNGNVIGSEVIFGNEQNRTYNTTPMSVLNNCREYNAICSSV